MAESPSNTSAGRVRSSGRWGWSELSWRQCGCRAAGTRDLAGDALHRSLHGPAWRLAPTRLWGTLKQPSGGPGGSWARTVWRELPGLRTEPVSTAPSLPLPALKPSEGEPEGFIFGNHPLLFRPFYPRHAPSSEGQLGPLITGDRNSSNTHFGTEKRAGGEGINP